MDSLPSLPSDGEGGGKSLQNGTKSLRSVWTGETEQELSRDGSDCFLPLEGSEEKGGRDDARKEMESEVSRPEQDERIDVYDYAGIASLDDTSRKVKTGVGTDEYHIALEKTIAHEAADCSDSPRIQGERLEDIFPNVTPCCGDTIAGPQDDAVKLMRLPNHEDSADRKFPLDNFSGEHKMSESSNIPGTGEHKLGESNTAGGEISARSAVSQENGGVCSVQSTGDGAEPDAFPANTNTQKLTPLEPRDPQLLTMKTSKELPNDSGLGNKLVEEASPKVTEVLSGKETDANRNIFKSKDSGEICVSNYVDTPKSLIIDSDKGRIDSETLSINIIDQNNGLRSVDVNENDPKSTDPGNTAGADTLQENNPKVVTFAEDKEVFDMGYVVPASVTVHLDTPVSSIAPGDVQISIEPVDPGLENTTYPITGILKTDEGGDSREQADQESEKHILAPAVLEDKDSSSLWGQENLNFSPEGLELRAESVGNSNLVDCSNPELDESKATLETPVVTWSPDKDSREGTLANVVNGALGNGATGFSEQRSHSGACLLNNAEAGPETITPTSLTAAPATAAIAEDSRNSVEEDDVAGHRGFVVEAVAEKDLFYKDDAGAAVGNGAAMKPDDRSKCLTAPGDAGSHSTDSNYQDTIGPLDNPQFLKTLNYTASQAFDQDEDFGLDARSFGGLQEPPDLDAGWAWVVLVASFLGASLLGACVYSAGLGADVAASLPTASRSLARHRWDWTKVS
ncbi:hypothetical protein ElyMa_006788300 [Elysia marginata]|uniref:Uncharacterized protein n=1 Tax=Elysia marginata TaxID=1093978 RepID=A0AAV4J4H4_9GAST|nr:hypothetical protein ElyMa_006788300 [Elysia marginata]